jgi:hypothetical protein
MTVDSRLRRNRRGAAAGLLLDRDRIAPLRLRRSRAVTDGLDGDLVHLIPEMLAGEPLDLLDAGEGAERGRGRPLGESSLARGAAGTADARQQ